MSNSFRNKGFSLTEVLMAAGILAIGFAFIAGMFPVGVKLTALTTEQTIAPIVADEAIAKVKLYGELYTELVTEPNLVDVLYATRFTYSNPYVDFGDILLNVPRGEFGEFTYPSTDISPEPKKYNWSALCGLLSDGNIHVTIFVSRKAGAGAKYRVPNFDYTQTNYGQVPSGSADGDWPEPVKVQVNMLGSKSLQTVSADEATFINAGSTIVDNQFDMIKGTWQIYRVLKRTSAGVIRLDRKWEGPTGGFVWVVPPAEGSGRNPCIGVYQTVIGL
ncbi:MAG: type IV pilus modification PilV family protein [Planctomycetota bacterium]|jgi:prepilin-type N-terminal cleavage/methylation domain-containing protein